MYWLESAVVGTFTFIKIDQAKGSGHVNPDGTRVVNVPDMSLKGFFLLHFGLFMFVHLIFILVMFWPPTLSFFDTLFVFISLCISHGVSYFTNYLSRREYMQFSPEQTLFTPYPRILIMHFTILFGGVIAKAIGAPTFALLLMITLKIIVDIYSHLNEHGSLPERMRFRIAGN